MRDPEVALLFPPTVYSNFGRYYPSTALLAAALESHYIPAIQIDVNQILLEALLAPTRLQAIIDAEDETLSRVAAKGDTSVLDPAIKELLAARVLINYPDCFRDAHGRLLPAGHPKVPLEILSALSDACYFDPPLATLTSAELWDLPQVHAIRSYFSESRLFELIPPSVHTVGISVPMGPQLGSALVLARALRDLRDVHVVLGGPTLTLLSDAARLELLQAHRCVDAIVPHQGELILVALARHNADHGQTPWRIPGVIALRNDDCPEAEEHVPLPILHQMPFGHYQTDIMDRLALPEVSVRQAEGCYWGQCSYCDYVQLYPKSAGRYRPQRVARLVEEVRFQQTTHGVNSFCLITESLPPHVGREFSKALLRDGLKIQWHSFAMVDPAFDVETLTLMAAAGCRSLCIGVETVVDRVLALVHKRATREMTICFFENCRRAGISLEINLIPNLPTTTYAEAVEAIEIIEKHLDALAGVSIFPFEATRSSEIGQHPGAFGLTVSVEGRVGGQAEFTANHLPVIDDAMTEIEFEKVLQRYRNLAARVTRRRLGEAAPATAVIDPDDDTLPPLRYEGRYAKLLIPNESFDALGPLLFNWTTGRMRHFSPSWRPILRWLSTQETAMTTDMVAEFIETITDLRGEESEAIARFVMLRLCDEGLLVRDAPAPIPSDCAFPSSFDVELMRGERPSNHQRY